MKLLRLTSCGTNVTFRRYAQCANASFLFRPLGTDSCLKWPLDFFLYVMRYLSHKEIVEKRKELFNLVNNDAFYSLSKGPSWARRTFWEKPLSDEDSFKMMLFLVGNGLDPCIAGKWVMFSQHWCGDGKKMEKKARQIG